MYCRKCGYELNGTVCSHCGFVNKEKTEHKVSLVDFRYILLIILGVFSIGVTAPRSFSLIRFLVEDNAFFLDYLFSSVLLIMGFVFIYMGIKKRETFKLVFIYIIVAAVHMIFMVSQNTFTFFMFSRGNIVLILIALSYLFLNKRESR